jgi:hypothetical protein
LKFDFLKKIPQKEPATCENMPPNIFKNILLTKGGEEGNPTI